MARRAERLARRNLRMARQEERLVRRNLPMARQELKMHRQEWKVARQSLQLAGDGAILHDPGSKVTRPEGKVAGQRLESSHFGAAIERRGERVQRPGSLSFQGEHFIQRDRRLAVLAKASYRAAEVAQLESMSSHSCVESLHFDLRGKSVQFRGPSSQPVLSLEHGRSDSGGSPLYAKFAAGRRDDQGDKAGTTRWRPIHPNGKSRSRRERPSGGSSTRTLRSAGR